MALWVIHWARNKITTLQKITCCGTSAVCLMGEGTNKKRREDPLFTLVRRGFQRGELWGPSGCEYLILKIQMSIEQPPLAAQHAFPFCTRCLTTRWEGGGKDTDKSFFFSSSVLVLIQLFVSGHCFYLVWFLLDLKWTVYIRNYPNFSVFVFSELNLLYLF